MTLSTKAKEVYSRIGQDKPKLGDLRKIAKEIKKDHELALELWSTGEYYPRLLAILIMDKKLLTQEVIDEFASEIEAHEYKERNQLADWLLANQLTKNKKAIALMETWEHAASPVLRRIFWFYQGRLRWSSKAPPDNTEGLLASLEQDMRGAEPEVQWTMNFAAAQIGIHEPEHRTRCVALGEELGLYIDERVPKGCTSPYLPAWIDTEVAKLG
jgi:3-methyladenine DNA glycosylase AlkD